MDGMNTMLKMDTRNIHLRLLGKDDVEVIPVRVDHHEVIIDSSDVGDFITKDDRALIAAAPDLLSMLIRADDFIWLTSHAMTTSEEVISFRSDIRAAIAKAEGSK